ncbi:MAG TPA: cell surface protein [Cellvibrio sp.]|nr:cell surface protein [Cellvibrio sp.]
MTMTFNKKILAVLISSTIMLTACGGDDGKDGATGPAGPQGNAGAPGPQGPAGADGANGANGANGADGANGGNGTDATAPAKMIRLATTPMGAELTGMFKTDNGEFFFNVQHPSDTLPGDEKKAAVGVWNGVDLDNLDPKLASLPVPVKGSAESQTTKVAVGSYQVLGREGDTYAGAMPFGFGNITNPAGAVSIKQSNNPDFNAFIPSNATGSEGYLFSAWEDRPGGVSRLNIAKQSDGTWRVNDAMNVNFGNVKGTMINCFGTVSPWGTPLTSEENYEAENTVRWNDMTYSTGYPNYADVLKIKDYLGGTFPNPYDYGYIVEITQPKAAAPVPVKHFTMGRYAHENPVIMPDKKTVYLTDDGSNKGFYKFVADVAGDLSAGTLYAAKVTQDATNDTAKAGFDIEWIMLAHATNAEVEAWIDSYDAITEANYVAGSTSYISDAEVTTWAAGGAADNRIAFLETLRAAKAKGATVEFNKMEGININYDGAKDRSVPFMYVAMAEVRGAMADTTGDIQVKENRCGAVYRFGFDMNYNVDRMQPVVVGGAYNGTSTTDKCDVNGIAQPDNIEVLDDGRVLIGEDSSNHVNNMLWIYNPNGM